MDDFLPVLIFILFLFVIELLFYGFSAVRGSDAKKVKKRLKGLQAEASEGQAIDIVRRRRLSDIPWLDRILSGLPGLRQIDNLLLQANTDMTLGLLLLTSLAAGAIGWFVASLTVKNALLALCVAVGFGYLPFLNLRLKKKQRMDKFQRQLPEALELIARTLRAGHAFSGGLKMVSEEFEDPIGTEFQRTLSEINFGVSVPEALKNLAQRVDCPDLKYFVVSVIIQRDTGGNLAEIIDTMGYIIRERFKLYGRIRVLSAEGKFSAVVLCALPFLMTVLIFFLNPKFIQTLNEDPIGRVMSVGALFMMVIGSLVMRKMIRIRV